MLALLVAALMAGVAPGGDSLSDLIAGDTAVEKVAGGFRFTEGPAWSPSGFLLFSDIPAERVVKLGADGSTSDFLHPSGQANGLVFDAEGNLYACQGGARQVVRIAPGGEQTVLASAYDGKKLNSPNDLDVDGSGGLYFTDPRYGKVEGLEQAVMGVYYVGAGGQVTRVISDLPRPNGILVSTDGKTLYVASTERRELIAYPIETPGKLGGGKPIFTGDSTLDGGGPDGMALDEKGNIYAAYKNLVVLDPQGKLLGRISVPEQPSNCTFGGKEGKTLYITARSGLYRIAMKVSGAPLKSFGQSPRIDAARMIHFPSFRGVTIDGKVGIGYGVAVTDIDGDKKPDIVLVDKDVVAWYRNPGWEKFIIALKLTQLDHVCVAARDIDGDGKAELAVGAGWNPADTIGSGSVHYLAAPADRTQRWEPIELVHEPTVHRMKWVLDPGHSWSLAVVPLHGRGNKNNEGAGVKALLYRKPADPKMPWTTEVLDDALHMTHNFDLVQWDRDQEEEVLIASREGVFFLDRDGEKWTKKQLVGSSPQSPFQGASEVRAGRLPGGKRFLVTIEPFHGNKVVAYVPPEDGGGLWAPSELDASLKGGHALACGDLLGAGSDQVVAGWREKDKEGKVGIRLFAPLDGQGKKWDRDLVDDNGMACEDLVLADLDGDGRLDLIASGRDSHNLKIYFNQGTGS